MEKAVIKNKSPAIWSVFLSRKDAANVTIGILGFFVGRVIVFGVVNPMFAGFLSNFIGFGWLFYISTFFTAIGLASKLDSFYLIKYMLCLLLIIAGNLFSIRRRKPPTILLKSSIGGCAALISGLAFAAISDFSVYYGFMAILEAAMVFCLTFVLKRGTVIIAGKKRRKLLSSEELISLAILLGAVVAGCSDIYIGFVSLRLFMCIFTTMTASYKGGSSIGALMGLLLGLMLYVTGYSNMSFIIILAFSSLIGGLFRRKSKWLSALGFASGSTIITAYLEPSMLNIESLFSLGTGIMAFSLVPNNFYFNIGSTINPTGDNAEEYIEKVKEITTSRLEAFSHAFGKLSQSFSKLSEKRTSLDQKDITKLIDEIALKACEGCKLNEYCWNTNFYDTYKTLFSILGACEKKGKIQIKDIPQSFKENCVDLDNFIQVSNRLFELYKLNLMWKNRIIESRELVSQQLAGVSSLIKNLSLELGLDINFREEIEDAIISELNKYKIGVDSVIVLENKSGKYEVTLTQKPCLYKKNCVKEISAIVSRVLGRQMKKEGSENDCSIKKGTCIIHLLEEQKFLIASGVAKAVKSKSRQSGDSYSFMELRNGQCLLALSDGMGSGTKAKEESTAAIELLEDFIESGFEKDMAIKMINSALVLKSSEDSFSTLDICSIDLYTGLAEFIKIGAATTFLLRNGIVSVIKSTSLPIGILNTVDLEVSTKEIKDKDIVVMVTDGVIEITDTYADKGTWIAEALESFRGTNPQDIADYLLLEAERKSGFIIQDDMTVLVSKIWEKK